MQIKHQHNSIHKNYLGKENRLVHQRMPGGPGGLKNVAEKAGIAKTGAKKVLGAILAPVSGPLKLIKWGTSPIWWPPLTAYRITSRTGKVVTDLTRPAFMWTGNKLGQAKNLVEYTAAAHMVNGYEMFGSPFEENAKATVNALKRATLENTRIGASMILGTPYYAVKHLALTGYETLRYPLSLVQGVRSGVKAVLNYSLIKNLIQRKGLKQGLKENAADYLNAIGYLTRPLQEVMKIPTVPALHLGKQTINTVSNNAGILGTYVRHNVKAVLRQGKGTRDLGKFYAHNLGFSAA